MDYEPWPEQGCSLAEAGQRTADRALWRELQRLLPVRATLEIASAQNRNAGVIIEQLRNDVVEKLKSQQIVAYGRVTPHAKPLRILPAYWWEITEIDWKGSAATGAASPPLFSEIRVFPVLLAPCRADLVSGRSFSYAFKQFILNDPEVLALSTEARKLSSEFEPVFTSCRCHPHGMAEWPLAFERWVMTSTVHPDPAKRSKFDVPRNPDPIEMVIAIEAVKHRYRSLITMLRDREIEGQGVPHPSGPVEKVLLSIWAHEDFHIAPASGDIFEDNPLSTARWDRLIKRWSGVMLEKVQATTTDADLMPPIDMLHVKPVAHDRLRSITPVSHDGVKTKAFVSAKLKKQIYEDCLNWLAGTMQASPNEPTGVKSQLLKEAQAKWPALSGRQFLEAWDEAVRKSGAVAWSAAGARKKIRHP